MYSIYIKDISATLVNIKERLDSLEQEQNKLEETKSPMDKLWDMYYSIDWDQYNKNKKDALFKQQVSEEIHNQQFSISNVTVDSTDVNNTEAVTVNSVSDIHSDEVVVENVIDSDVTLIASSFNNDNYGLAMSISRANDSVSVENKRNSICNFLFSFDGLFNVLSVLSTITLASISNLGYKHSFWFMIKGVLFQFLSFQQLLQFKFFDPGGMFISGQLVSI